MNMQNHSQMRVERNDTMLAPVVSQDTKTAPVRLSLWRLKGILGVLLVLLLVWGLSSPARAQEMCRSTVPLAAAQGEQSSSGPGVFYRHAQTITVPEGATVLLSGSPEGSGFRTDDVITVTVDGKQWGHDFRDRAFTQIIPVAAAQDITHLFAPGVNTIEIALEDVLYPVFSTSAYWLIIGGPCVTATPSPTLVPPTATPTEIIGLSAGAGNDDMSNSVKQSAPDIEPILNLAPASDGTNIRVAGITALLALLVGVGGVVAWRRGVWEWITQHGSGLGEQVFSHIMGSPVAMQPVPMTVPPATPFVPNPAPDESVEDSLGTTPPVTNTPTTPSVPNGVVDEPLVSSDSNDMESMGESEPVSLSKAEAVERALEYYRDHPRATLAEVGKVVGKSPDSVKGYLKELEKAGRITRDGRTIHVVDSEE